VVQVAVEAVGDRGIVVAGVHAPGWHQARHWAELAGEDGAHGVLALPPTMYRASTAQIVDHYERIAEAGLPIMAYNNPIDTKVDLVPAIVAEIAAIDNVVAVKEFSGDVRRAFEISELCDIDVIAGADDAFPAQSVEIYDLMTAGRYAEARDLYQRLVALFRWDSRTEFVQAIKLSMELAGRYGGPCRPPRGPLTAEHEQAIRADMQRAVDALAARQAKAV
jgi:4-hydroxy-tetrahydrodipicolinate synthase